MPPAITIERPVDGATPQHRAVPARRAFVRKQCFAHGGMNAVGADQHVAARRRPVRAVAVEKIGGDAGFVLAGGAEPVSGMDARLAEPRADRLIDHALQTAAMDGKLRYVVAGIEPARFAPDLLAEAVGVKQLIGAAAARIEPFQEPERGKLLDRVRQRVDADAELAYLIGLLEDFAVDAARVQHQRGGKTADAAADDDDLHGGLLCQAGSAAQP